MIISISEKDKLYRNTLALLKDIRLTMGGSGVDATIRRHKDLRNFLVQYQKDALLDLEKDIALLQNQ